MKYPNKFEDYFILFFAAVGIYYTASLLRQKIWGDPIPTGNIILLKSLVIYTVVISVGLYKKRKAKQDVNN